MALIHVDFISDVLHMSTQMDVLLPEESKGKVERPYPVLYLLHGMSDDHTAWQRKTSIERYTDGRNLAVVMPTTHLGWYSDQVYGPQYWTFLSRELPGIVRRFFPNISEKREDTFVAGLSMGGYGALKCVLSAPDVFCAAGALSAGADVLSFAEAYTQSGVFRDIYGDSLETIRSGENDLFVQAEKLAASGKPLPDIYMWCGLQDGLLEGNRKMRDCLTRLRYPLTYEESDGTHSWPYWDEKIRTVLDWLPRRERREE